jgi:IclR family transcriptional regulator, KDG regulon repressor
MVNEFEKTKNDYNINSLIRSVNILEILANNGETSIQELSRLSGLGKSSVHRILGTFKTMGYVNQNGETGRYYATIKLFEIGNKVANRIPYRKIARPYLEELFEKCHETINIGMVEQNEIIFLDKIVTREPLRIELEVGRRVPAYCSALGKAIIAFSENSFDIGCFDFNKITKNTIDNPESFKREMEGIRKQGYAIDDEEYIYGLYCIAVPIMDRNSRPVTSISIATPVMRMNEERKELFVKMLKETASLIANCY